MRNKGYRNLFARKARERLFNLGCVAVARNLVSVEALVELGIMVALNRLSACSRNSARTVADNALHLDKSVDNRGSERERRTGCVAAGVRDNALALDIVTEKLGKSVNRLLVQSLVEEGSAVPFGVFVLALKAEIRAEVDKRLARADALSR